MNSPRIFFLTRTVQTNNRLFCDVFYLDNNTQNIKESSTRMARQLMRNSMKKKLQGKLRKIYLSNKLRQLLKLVSEVAQTIC